MEDVLAYLHSKGIHTKRATGENIHCACFYHGEAENDRGRLYINVDPNAEIPGLHTCFVCGERGSLNKIKRHFGDPIDTGDDQPSAKYSSVYQALQRSANYYHERLLERPEKIEWLKSERGLTEETIKKHKLGWADGKLSTYFAEYLAENKGAFTYDNLYDTHLFVKDGARLVDFLRDQITIPYVSFGSVTTIRGKDINGKYVTPPGVKTRLFNSDSLLEADEAVICEGEFDALIAEQFGYAAVGLPGAGIWQDSFNPLFSKTSRVIAVFDNDSAGRKGLEKVSENLGHRVRTVTIPALTGPEDHNDLSDWVVKQGKTKQDFESLISKADGGLLVSVDDAFHEHTSLQGTVGLKLGFEMIDLGIRPGLLPAQLLVIEAKTGTGKGQPLDSLILTPDGIKTYGDLSVGSHVFGRDGRPTLVTGIYDRGLLPTYRFAFTDGSSQVVDADHIWRVGYRYGKKREWKWEDRTTRELLEENLRNGKEYRFIIPMCDALQFEEKEFPISPYTLGALIANGSLTHGSAVLSTPRQSIANRVLNEHSGKAINRSDEWEDSCPRYTVHGMVSKIADLSLNVKSKEKFIPEQYFFGSVQQRIDLLHGLMDNDGSARHGRTNVLYHTSSRQLACDVVRLVNSLGGTGMVRTLNRKAKGVEYCVGIMLPKTIPPFFARNWKGSPCYQTGPRRAIVSIQRVDDQETRCISVEAPDSLYVTGLECVVTHNTISLLNIFHRMSTEHPDSKVLFISLEQTRGDWFERARRIWAFYNRDLIYPSSDSERDLAIYSAEVDRQTLDFWRHRIMMVDKNRVLEEELNAAVKDYESAMGSLPDLIAVDYLGYWARAFKGRDNYERTTEAVMSAKALAKDWRVPLITPSQINRGAEFGREPEVDDARDSGAVEETADFVFMMWAPDSQKGKEIQERTGEVLLKIGKSRHGGVGLKQKMQFCPVTLALVPVEDPQNSVAAKRELDYQTTNKGLTWEKAIWLHHRQPR